MPRGGCATGGRECVPHAHQESKTSGNKRKTERKRKDEQKTGRGERGVGGSGGRGWGQFFLFGAKFRTYASESRLLGHNNCF
jgi:hypothetical protein